MSDEWIGMVFIIGILIVVAIGLFLRHKNKVAQQETVRLMIEKGQELSPEVIESLASPNANTKQRDLRRAIISFALGGGFVALALAIPADAGTQTMLALSAFPLLIGAAYLLMHFVASDEK